MTATRKPKLAAQEKKGAVKGVFNQGKQEVTSSTKILGFVPIGILRKNCAYNGEQALAQQDGKRPNGSLGGGTDISETL